MKKKLYPKSCLSCLTFNACLLTFSKRLKCPCSSCLIKVMCLDACNEFKVLKNMGFVDSRIVIYKKAAEF